MSGKEATRAPAHSDHLMGIAFGLGLAFLAAFQQFKLPVVLPVLLADYGYDRTLAGGYMSVYAFFGLFLSIPLGRAIQRHGAASLISWALILMIFGNALTLVAPESGWLVLASRGLEGIAFAVLAIGGPALANANASQRSLPVVAGLMAAWIPVGQLTATLLAPVAMATSSWRMLWYVSIGATALFFVWTIINRVSGRVVLTPPRSIGAHKPGASAELTPRERRALILNGALFMLWSGQYFAYMTWLPQYLVEVHGLALTDAQWGYAIPVTLVLVVCVLTGLLLQRGAPLGTLMVGALVIQAAVWWLLPFTGGGAAGIASLVIYGTGAGVVPTCMFALPGVILGRGHDTARAFGIVMTGRNMGVLIGPVLVAQAFKMTGTWDLAAPIFGTVTTACLITAIVLARQMRR
jgi:predicted MFS family arabinose efflux permease